MPWLEAVAVPVAPQEGVQVPRPESVDRLQDLALEGEPAQLTIGDDFAARLLLERDHVVDRAVLGGLQRCRPDRLVRESLSGLQQPRGPEQATDMVRVDAPHRLLPTPGADGGAPV